MRHVESASPAIALITSTRKLLGARFKVRGSLPQLTRQQASDTCFVEAATANQPEGTITSVNFAPHTVSAYGKISCQMAQQASLRAEQMLMSDFGTLLARAVDAEAIGGSGASGTPLGVANMENIGAFNGGSIAYADIRNAQRDVLTADGVVNADTTGWISPPAVADILKSRQRVASTDSPIWTGTLANGSIDGERAIATPAAPASTLIYGDWSQLVIAERRPDDRDRCVYGLQRRENRPARDVVCRRRPASCGELHRRHERLVMARGWTSGREQPVEPIKLPPARKLKIRAIGERRFRHAGRLVEADEVIEVDVDLARMLVQTGKAEHVDRSELLGTGIPGKGRDASSARPRVTLRSHARPASAGRAPNAQNRSMLRCATITALFTLSPIRWWSCY